MKKYLLITLLLLYSTNLLSQNYGSWSDTDSLNIARSGHAMVVLKNGNILVSGNDVIDTTESYKSCELFDIITKTWRETTPTNKSKDMHHMVLLNNGDVLAFGGILGRNCEIFNPTTEEWRFTDSMITLRNFGGEAVTKLEDGRIIVMGGKYWNSDSGTTKILNNCEIYDPATEKWEIAAPMCKPNYNHSAILLNNGNILVAGSKYCEIYNPLENIWFETDSLEERGGGNRTILLDNNNVLLIGGAFSILNIGEPVDKRCAIYDTQTEKWRYVGELNVLRNSHSVFKISEKYILVVGGEIYSTESWEIYDVENFESIYYEIFEVQNSVRNVINKYNTIQMKNSNILISGGMTWDNSGTMPILSITKRCSIFDIITSINYKKDKQKNYKLSQNYPNPFNPNTTIKYSIPVLDVNHASTTNVVLSVYDILGREISTLVNKEQKAGNYEVKFNAKNLSSGIYYYKITIGSFAETKKMLLLK